MGGFGSLPSQRVPSSTAPLCCLIVEDEALIALSLEDHLDEMGVQTAGPF